MIWSGSALREVTEIFLYIAAEAGVDTAMDMRSRLMTAGESLGRFPERGRRTRTGRVLAFVPPYLIHYDVNGQEVRITGVRHGARRPLP